MNCSEFGLLDILILFCAGWGFADILVSILRR